MIANANYPERDALREAYLAWLSRCEAALRDRPTPDLAIVDKGHREKRGDAMKRILHSL